MVEIITNDHAKKTTGQKRNELVKQAKGEYIVFHDDDDPLQPEYISSILEAIEAKPDVITFDGWMTTDGAHPVDFYIHLGEKYEARKVNGREVYYRFPNHLCPVRREYALQTPFPHKFMGEDYEYAVRLQRLLKTSVHISKKLYHYDFKTKK